MDNSKYNPNDLNVSFGDQTITDFSKSSDVDIKKSNESDYDKNSDDFFESIVRPLLDKTLDKLNKRQKEAIDVSLNY